jgi:hypothetical protein
MYVQAINSTKCTQEFPSKPRLRTASHIFRRKDTPPNHLISLPNLQILGSTTLEMQIPKAGKLEAHTAGIVLADD